MYASFMANVKLLKRIPNVINQNSPKKNTQQEYPMGGGADGLREGLYFIQMKYLLLQPFKTPKRKS